MSASKKILFVMTGSIACYKACQVLSRLKQNGYQIKTVLTESALNFVGRSTVEGLTGETPLTDLYEHGKAMDHINLVRWADLIIVAPATANYINKIAAGLGDDLASTLFLAHDFEKPFLIAPAMNTKMYLHPVTKASIEKLRGMGVEILETASGVLACGEIGSGRLLEPDLLQREIENRIGNTKPGEDKPTPSKAPRILITAGGTSEPIDDVRVITNRSSGATSAKIADALIESGINVTFLHSQSSKIPTLNCNDISFETFADLQSDLTNELKTNHYDWVIHAAAVSDYSVVPQQGKISSQAEELNLTFKRNPKLISQIKNISPNTKLIGFKLTSQADEKTIQAKVTELLEKANCDLVIQNDWAEIKGGKRHFRIFSKLEKENFADSIEALNLFLFQNIMKQKDHL